MSLIILRHNMEIAHRLYDLKGKCEQIHGHSMWVELSIFGTINKGGILVNDQETEFEFGAVKRAFREHLDSTYDHRLLLNKVDPWAGPIMWLDQGQIKALPEGAMGIAPEQQVEQVFLPGLSTTDGDPTTENLAQWISLWASHEFEAVTRVRVQETAVNAAEAGAVWLHDQQRAEWSY